MLDTRRSTLDQVRDVIAETLGLGKEHERLERQSSLFGAIPELDSFAVVQLALALEERFGFTIEDEDFSAEVFDTLGSLSDFIDSHRSA